MNKVCTPNIFIKVSTGDLDWLSNWYISTMPSVDQIKLDSIAISAQQTVGNNTNPIISTEMDFSS